MKTKTFKLNHYTSKYTSDCVERVLKNCWKKPPGLGIFPLQQLKYFKNRRSLQKKWNRETLLRTFRLKFWQTGKEGPAEKTDKCHSKANCFPFLSRKSFSRFDLRDERTACFVSATKLGKFTLHARKKNYSKKKFSQKKLFGIWFFW